MGYICVVVNVSGVLWDRLYVFSDRVERLSFHNTSESHAHGDFYSDSDFVIVDSSVLSGDGDTLLPQKRLKFPIVLNGYELSYFYHLLRLSNTYRLHATRFWNFCTSKHIPIFNFTKLAVSVIDPPKQIIDYSWNARITCMISERSELDTAMSWLSTLGGAYSALGDHFIHCAQMAGRISLQQFKIALRLGDDNTVSRCKLFIALSLMQLNRFRLAQHLIQEQYQLACNSPCPDIRLIRMCRGVWCKLRYERSRYIRRKRTAKSRQ